MKKGWSEATIGELCQLATGGTPSKAKREYFEGGEIKWLVSGDVHQREIFDCEGRITESGLENSNARYLPINSVVIALNGQGKTRGTVAMLRTKATCNQSLVSIFPNDISQLLPEFLFHNLAGRYSEIRRLTGDAGNERRGLNMPLIRSIKVPVPPLEEQKRIVAILDEAFEGLARARENATANIENAKQLFDSFLFRIFQLQEGDWVIEDLNTNVRFVDYRGKTPPKRETGVRLITAKNVKFGYIQRHPEEFIDENAYETWMSRGYPKRGDVLFTTEAPLANVAQLDISERVVIGQRLITMQTNEKVLLPAFLKFALMSPQMNKAIRDRGTGATVQGIKASLLKKVPLAYPKSLHLQAEIASKCDEAFSSMQALVDLQFEKRESLDTLRQSLLHKAFSGQLA